MKSIPKFCYTEGGLRERKFKKNTSLELRENFLDARVGSRRGRLTLELYVYCGIPFPAVYGNSNSKVYWHYDECSKALETFQNDKAPREDGFTIKFYKYFFDLLGNDLLASFIEAHAKGELSISQQRGIIILTPFWGWFALRSL